jgi:hypothetical protein
MRNMKKYNTHQRLADGSYLTILDRPPIWERVRGFVLSILLGALLAAISWNLQQ